MPQDRGGVAGRCFRALAAVLALAVVTAAAGDATNDPVVACVQAMRGTAHTLVRRGALASCLYRRPRAPARVQPFGFGEAERAVMARSIGFALVGPGLYVLLKRRHGAVAPSTVIARQGEAASACFTAASVIFVRAVRGELDMIGLRGRMPAAVLPRYSGGWHLTLARLRAVGIWPPRHGSVRFPGSHHAAFETVLEGQADAGTVRSRVREHLAAQDRQRLADVRVLGRVRGDAFPLLHGMRAHPEWPFARLTCIDGETSHHVAGAPLTMPSSAPAAAQTEIAGWAAGLDYRPVRKLLLANGAPSFGRVSLSRLVRNHPLEGMVLAAFAVFALGALVVLATLNRRLHRVGLRLQEEVRARLAAEAALVEERDRLHAEAAEQRRALEQMALRDELTGLANRALLYERLDHEFAQYRREHRRLAVLMVDLDDFKEVNDTLGHYHGDLLLQGVAARFRECVREADLVARWGGDEFVVVLSGCPGARAAEEVAGKLLESLAKPLVLDGIPVYVRASIGIALAPQDGVDGDTLIRHADVAMYAAKRAGGGFARYRRQEDDHRPDRLRLSAELTEAVRTGAPELCLWYQPISRSRGGELCGVEALLRWRRPGEGEVSPEVVVAIAEQTGLIRPLTLHVLNLACRQWRRWAAQGLRVRVAVNLSAWSLQDRHFGAQFAELVEAWEIPPRMLTLEVTETALMTDPDAAARVLRALRALGARVAIDDFGTGYSSLARLWQLPVDEIKIDRRFVQGMEAPREAAIVRTVVALGRELGASLVAEGVETPAQAQVLRALGVDCLQGYHIARPMPPDELAVWARRRCAVAAQPSRDSGSAGSGTGAGRPSAEGGPPGGCPDGGSDGGGWRAARAGSAGCTGTAEG